MFRIVARAAVVGCATLCASLALGIYFLQYHEKLGASEVERIYAPNSARVDCQKAWRYGVWHDPAYVLHYTYRCRVVWKPGLGPPETVGVRVNLTGITDREI